MEHGKTKGRALIFTPKINSSTIELLLTGRCDSSVISHRTSWWNRQADAPTSRGQGGQAVPLWGGQERYLFTAFSLLRRGGLRGTGDGYLTLEAKRLTTSHPLFLSLLVEMH